MYEFLAREDFSLYKNSLLWTFEPNITDFPTTVVCVTNLYLYRVW